MGWQVSWRVFNRKRWVDAHADAALELVVWEEAIAHARWTNVADVLRDYPRAAVEGDRVWFLLPRARVRIGTQLDFYRHWVWVRDIEPL